MDHHNSARTALRLPEGLKTDLEEEARQRGWTFSQLVRLVLSDFVRPGSVPAFNREGQR